MPRAWIVRNTETDSIVAAFASLDEATGYAKAENTRYQTDAWRAQAGKFDALPSYSGRHQMNVTALGIKPMSFGVEQRVEAAIKAAVMGRGVHMEVGNSTTRFYADDSVPVGHIRITAPPKYKAVPESAPAPTYTDETPF